MAALRRTLADFSPSAAVRFATFSARASDSMQRERLRAVLSGFFGLIALALAAVGVYGVISYTAISRQREVAIRMALGARASDLARTVVGRVAVVSGIGLAMGLMVAFSVSALAGSFLYDIDPRDPGTVLLTAAVIAASAALAAAMPVRRALRTDPVVALNSEHA